MAEGRGGESVGAEWAALGSEEDGRGGSDGRKRARARGGLRIGPLVFVPEFRRGGADDPWAHRKGEPRVLALLWAVYLMVASLLTVFAGRGVGAYSTRQLEYASLAFVTIAGFGAAVLVPMVRLSQRRPRRVGVGLAGDAAVVSLPLAIVVPALAMVTGWPWSVSIAIAVLLVGWTLLGAGCVAVALSVEAGGAARSGDVTARGRAALRGWAMAAVVLLVGAGPMLDTGWRPLSADGLPGVLHAVALLSSPLTGPWALCAREAENMRASVSGVEWACALAPVATGAVLFATAGLAERRARVAAQRGVGARP